MKKMILGLAALVAGSVMAIESANIVGYTNNQLVDGSVAIGTGFIGVGSTGYSLIDIIPQGIGEVSKGVVTIMTLDTKGNPTATYKYYRGGTGKFVNEGWYQGIKQISAENENLVSFPVGTGLWVTGTSELSLTTSGEVLSVALPCELISGNCMLSNPYPCATSLKKITLTGVPESSKGEITIMTLDSKGNPTATYKYYRGGTGKFVTEGWYQGITLITEENDPVIPAGKGLWVKGIEGVTLTFEKPF